MLLIGATSLLPGGIAWSCLWTVLLESAYVF